MSITVFESPNHKRDRIHRTHRGENDIMAVTNTRKYTNLFIFDPKHDIKSVQFEFSVIEVYYFKTFSRDCSPLFFLNIKFESKIRVEPQAY